MRKILFLILAAGLLQLGCAGRINKMMDSWKGHHKAELLDSWGPPNQVHEDGRGGEIYVYTRTTNVRLSGYSKTKITTDRRGKSTAKTKYYPGQTITQENYRMFWINENGIIYSWKWKGRRF